MCTVASPDHTTDDLTEALHINIPQVLIAITVTHHTGDHPHVAASEPTPEITAAHRSVPHTD